MNEKKTILIVEDEDLVARDTKRILKNIGYNALIANSGEEAIEIVETEPKIDLILMDVELRKGMNGPEAAKHIIEKHEIPLIFISEYTEKSIVEKTESISSYGYVVKNTGETVLLVSIKMAFRLFEAKQREKEKEKALKKSENLYRNLYEKAPIGIYRCSLDCIILAANPAFIEMLGYDCEAELKGKDLKSEMTEGSREDFVSELLKHGKAQSLESVWKKKDGKTLNIIESACLIYDDENKPIYYEGTVEDITDYYQKEEEIRLLSKVVQKVDDIVFVTDRDGYIEYVNDSFTKYTGYYPKEAIGEYTNILKSGYHSEEEYRILWETILKGEVFKNIAVNKKKNGDHFYYDQTITPLFDEHGNISSFISTGRDITERKKMEEQLRLSQKLDSLGKLAGGIAHDFNNVLTIIQSALGTIINKTSDNSILRYTKMIESAAERGAEVAKRLLAFARADKMDKKPISLNAVVEELVQTLKHTMPKNIEIETQLAQEEPHILGDHGQLYHMLLNLSINARDAILAKNAKQPGRILLKIEEADDELVRSKFAASPTKEYYCLSIQDNGTGMEEKTKSRIYEPLYSTKPKGKGTGLGMSAVMSIINSHNGFIDLETEVGKGTSFYIYFPKTNEREAETKPEKEKIIKDMEATVLLVEDEEMVAELMVEMLEDKGLRAMMAKDGVEALNIYRKKCHEIDVVILDMGLPKLSGEIVFDEMKKINSDIIALLATGYIDDDMQKKLSQSGMKGFIQKPYREDEIINKVIEVLS
jgi:PAS domain S-box-containing protein